MPPWPEDEPGVVLLPDGRRVVGRAVDASGSAADLVVVALGRRPATAGPEVRWIRWPDFGLPTSAGAADTALLEAFRRSAHDRVAVCCGGGRGRTGAMLAVLASLAGIAPGDALRWVRGHGAPGAAETPWQARWVRTTARRLRRAPG